jgi:hypothetical protein
MLVYHSQKISLSDSLSVGGDPEKVKKSERERFRDDKLIDEIIDTDVIWRKSNSSIHY